MFFVLYSFLISLITWVLDNSSSSYVLFFRNFWLRYHISDLRCDSESASRHFSILYAASSFLSCSFFFYWSDCISLFFIFNLCWRVDWISDNLSLIGLSVLFTYSSKSPAAQYGSVSFSWFCHLICSALFGSSIYVYPCPLFEKHWISFDKRICMIHISSVFFSPTFFSFLDWLVRCLAGKFFSILIVQTLSNWI